MHTAVSGAGTDKEVLTVHGWQQEVDQQHIDIKKLHEEYIQCLGPCKYDSTVLEVF